MKYKAESVTGQEVFGKTIRVDGLYCWLGDGYGREIKVYLDTIQLISENGEE